MEELSGKTGQTEPESDKKPAKLYKHDRNTYVDLIIREEQKKFHQYPEREDMINEIIDKLKQEEEEKQAAAKNKNKRSSSVNGDRRVKGTFALSSRVTVAAEAEYVGERLPFYNTHVPEGEEEAPEESGKKNKKNKKQKQLFYPDVRLI